MHIEGMGTVNCGGSSPLSSCPHPALTLALAPISPRSRPDLAPISPRAHPELTWAAKLRTSTKCFRTNRRTTSKVRDWTGR